MTYSYSQISQYIGCPRRYRHHYLDGWQEKDNRAAMLFGRAFEQAIAALFRREEPAAVLFEQWGVCKNMEQTTPAMTSGTACCNKASSCSTANVLGIGPGMGQ